MKKFALLGVLVASVAACLFLTGCDDEYNVPTKTGGGGRQQPYLPKRNSHGGQYIHLDKK